MIRVAINGFGRIGRLAFREIITTNDFDIVAINDLSNASELAHLLKYDTNYRSFHETEIKAEGDYLVIKDQKRVRVYCEKDPAKLPWQELAIDLVFECTGKFTSVELAQAHLDAGAKKVLISAPGKGNLKTIVYGVNENLLTPEDRIVSAASCTTNCLAPVLQVIENNFGIEKGFMITIHAYTNDQATLDIAHSKGIMARRGRACAQNIIPTTTGAASALGLVIPSLLNKLDGVAYRVPVPDGSLIDVTLELKRNTSIDEINNLIETHQTETLAITYDPVVSSDIIGKKVGALVDALATNIVEFNGKQLVKVVAWYDNEMGYTAQMMRTARAWFK